MAIFLVSHRETRCALSTPLVTSEAHDYDAPHQVHEGDFNEASGASGVLGGRYGGARLRSHPFVAVVSPTACVASGRCTSGRYARSWLRRSGARRAALRSVRQRWM